MSSKNLSLSNPSTPKVFNLLTIIIFLFTYTYFNLNYKLQFIPKAPKKRVVEDSTPAQSQYDKEPIVNM